MIAGLLRRPFADGELLDVEGVPVRLRVNARARRVSLRVDPRTREAVATAPSARRLKEAAAFAKTKRDWLLMRLAQARPLQPLTAGETIPLRGRDLRLEQGAGAAAARLSDDGTRLSAGGDPAGFARRVMAFLKREARRDLLVRTAIHAELLSVAAPTVSLGDPRTRWGSCTAARSAIRYSWRLILAPPYVLDYVAAHEVAHLLEPNHGARFWALTERLYGDPRPARRWLREHGAALHAIG